MNPDLRRRLQLAALSSVIMADATLGPLAGGVRKARSLPARRVGFGPSEANVGRNSLCPCGSGKKFKACHLNETKHTSEAS